MYRPWWALDSNMEREWSWPKDMYVCVATCSNMYMYSLAQFSKPKNNTTTTNEGKYIYLNVPNTEYPGIIKVERRLFKTEYSVRNF